MKRNFKKLATVLLATLLAGTATAQKTFDIDLYKHFPAVKSSNPKDTARVRVFLPKESMATGKAVVICPGGGYDHLALDHEGYQWGEFFAGQGVAAVVLKYRMPHGNPDVPVSDAEEAMRLVRRNAQQWHVNSQKVGIVGFSAGGHLASVIATTSKAEVRPNFQILFYPVITMMPGYAHKGSLENFLGKSSKKKDQRDYSTDTRVNRHTPRALIMLCDDDDVVAAANGVNYYTELYRQDVPASLHVYPNGGHGWGMNKSFRYNIEMILELRAWLTSF